MYICLKYVCNNIYYIKIKEPPNLFFDIEITESNNNISALVDVFLIGLLIVRYILLLYNFDDLW